jgi:hypothetical protein
MAKLDGHRTKMDRVRGVWEDNATLANEYHRDYRKRVIRFFIALAPTLRKGQVLSIGAASGLQPAGSATSSATPHSELSQVSWRLKDPLLLGVICTQL